MLYLKWTWCNWSSNRNVRRSVDRFKIDALCWSFIIFYNKSLQFVSDSSLTEAMIPSFTSKIQQFTFDQSADHTPLNVIAPIEHNVIPTKTTSHHHATVHNIQPIMSQTTTSFNPSLHTADHSNDHQTLQSPSLCYTENNPSDPRWPSRPFDHKLEPIAAFHDHRNQLMTSHRSNIHTHSHPSSLKRSNIRSQPPCKLSHYKVNRVQWEP